MKEDFDRWLKALSRRDKAYLGGFELAYLAWKAGYEQAIKTSAESAAAQVERCRPEIK